MIAALAELVEARNISYHEIRESLLTSGAEDLRTAAFVVSINKVGVAYEQLGIFP